MEIEEKKEDLEEQEEEEQQSNLKGFYSNNKKLIWIAGIIIILVIILSLFVNKNSNDEFYIMLNGNKINDINLVKDNSVNLSVNTKNTVSWESSNQSIASVNDGMVKGLTKGDITISAVESNSKRKATCVIHVMDGNPNIVLNSINFPKGILVISEGDSYNIVLNNDPVNGYIKNKSFSSSNMNILTVDNEGKVNALKKGFAKVNVMVNDNQLSSSIMVHVVSKKVVSGIVSEIENITFTNSSDNLEVGQTKKISYNKIPSTASDLTVMWESGNEKIVSIDEEGNITGLSVGTTNVIAKNIDGKEIGSMVVSVSDSFTVSVPTDVNVTIGNSTKVNVNTNSSNANRSSLTFETDNASVIKVVSNDDGKTISISGLTKGMANVIIKNNGIEKGRIKVSVVEQPVVVDSRGYSPQSSDANDEKFIVNTHDKTKNNAATGPVTIKFVNRNDMGTTSVKVCRYKYGSSECDPKKNGVEVKLETGTYKIAEKGDWVLRVIEYKNGVQRRPVDDWYILIDDIKSETSDKVTGCYANTTSGGVGGFVWLNNQSISRNQVKTVILYKEDCEEAKKGNICFRDNTGKYVWGRNYSTMKNASYVKGISKEADCLAKN